MRVASPPVAPSASAPPSRAAAAAPTRAQPATRTSTTPTMRTCRRRPTRVADGGMAAVLEAVAVEERVDQKSLYSLQAVRHRVEAVPLQVEIGGAVLAERAARGEQPERRQHDHRAEADRGCPRSPSWRGAAAGSASVLGHCAVVDPQQRQVGPLEVRDRRRGQRELDDAGDDEVRESHRRDRLRRGGTARRAGVPVGAFVEQVGLQAELDRGAQRGGVEADVGADTGRERPPRRRQRRAPRRAAGRRRSRRTA